VQVQMISRVTEMRSNRSFDTDAQRHCAAKRAGEPTPCGAMPLRAGQFQRWMLRMRRSSLILGFVYAALLSSPAVSCSPPGPSGKEFFEYSYVAEIVPARPPNQSEKAESRPAIPALLKVIEAEGPGPAVGQLLTVQLAGNIGADCRGTRPLTLRDWAQGAKVRVKTNDLRLAEQIYYAE
jgi:hypothetical protein